MFWTIIAWVATAIFSYLLRPKIETPATSPAKESDFNVPTAEQGRAIPVVFGTIKVEGPNCVWYGDISSKKVESKGVYKYNIGMHLAVCLVAESLNKVYVDDVEVYTTPVTSNSTIYIDQETIFGGTEREGGILGYADVMFGEETQSTNSYLVTELGTSNIPAFRGIFSIVLKSMYIGTSAYLKPWQFEIKRIGITDNYTTQWYNSKAAIGSDMNPAHILYEAITSSKWGKGEDTSRIDNTSFADSADTLYTESFGLSIINNRNRSEIDEFIKEILQYIDGVLYQDDDGLYVLKLIRDDYTPASLTTYDEDVITDITSFVRSSTAETINQVAINYTDRSTYEKATIVVQDIGAYVMQGSVISTILDYPAVYDKTLANELASRELKAATSRLFKATLIGNRNMASLKPGDVFKWSWNNYGIVQSIVRVINVSYGSLDNASVKLDVIEDIFSQALTIYADPSDTGWTNPISDPVNVTVYQFVPAPVTAIVNAGIYPISQVDTIPETSVFGLLFAKKSTTDTIDMNIIEKASETSTYSEEQLAYFCPNATITTNIGYTDTSIVYTNDEDMSGLTVGQFIFINTEAMILDNINYSTKTITVGRGCLDTVPEEHTLGDRLWVAGNNSYLTNEYTVHPSYTIQIKMLPRTGKGNLSESSATVRTCSRTDRLWLPYPAARIRVNNLKYNNSGVITTTFTDPLAISWEHRSRLDQSQLYDQEDTGVTKETNVEYEVQFWDSTQTTHYDKTGITVDNYNYSNADEIADFGSLQSTIYVRILTSRSGDDSLYYQEYRVDRS